MKAHYRAFNGRLIIEVEGSNIKELFEQIGPVAEVLDGDDSCGKCSSPHIFPRSREAQGFVYYELVCSDCGAKLSFGQHKEGGTLWPKREDDNGNKLDNKGWHIYLGIAAPKASAPPPSAGGRDAAEPPTPASRPQAKPETITQDPRLAQYVERMKGQSSTEQSFIIGEICDAIDGHSGSKKLAEESWKVAVKRYGDPLNTPRAIEPVLNHLLGVLAIEEQKKGLRTT